MSKLCPMQFVSLFHTVLLPSAAGVRVSFLVTVVACFEVLCAMFPVVWTYVACSLLLHACRASLGALEGTATHPL